MKNGVTIHVDSKITEDNCRTLVFREKGMTLDGRLLDRSYHVALEQGRLKSLRAYDGEQYVGGYERTADGLWADQPFESPAIIYDGTWEVGAKEKKQFTSDLDYLFFIRMKTKETSKNPFDWKAGFFLDTSSHHAVVTTYDGSKAEFNIVPNGILYSGAMSLVIDDNVERTAKQDQKKLNALDVLARLAALDEEKQQAVLQGLSQILVQQGTSR